LGASATKRRSARFTRLNHPRIHLQTPPSRTRHLVAGMVVEEADAAGD
jgi:hypothetical protein